jgi:hypothetical protein
MAATAALRASRGARGVRELLPNMKVAPLTLLFSPSLLSQGETL